MIPRLCSESFKLHFSSVWTENFQMYKLGFKEAETRDQIANIHWIMKKTKEFQKKKKICFIDYMKPFNCVDQNKLWKILKQMGTPEQLMCLLRNLYVVSKAS